MRHIQGHSRDQITLFPESLDEYITDDNPVRSSELLAGCLSVPPDNLGETESQPSYDYHQQGWSVKRAD